MPFKEAKSQLRSRLDAFTDTLNRQMFSNAGASNYDKWLESHQPFHWIAEFYQIIHGNGGFDVIIGNPPYVGYNEKKFSYTLIHNYDTFRTGNLYTFCIERSLRIVHPYSYLSMIVPISLIGNTRMELCLNKLLDHTLWISSYSGDTHPGTLFSGVQQNLCIFDAKINNIERLYTTNFIRFYDGSYERSFLFNSRVYYSNNKLKPFLKIGEVRRKKQTGVQVKKLGSLPWVM